MEKNEDACRETWGLCCRAFCPFVAFPQASLPLITHELEEEEDHSKRVLVSRDLVSGGSPIPDRVESSKYISKIYLGRSKYTLLHQTWNF